MAAPELSVCIVNWNTRELLRGCLASLRDDPPALPHEVLVADNASADGSAALVAAEFPTVRLFANDANLGYAEGNNQVLRAARGRWLLLLNSDTAIVPELDPAPFDKLVAHLAAHPFVGAVAARLVQPDGLTQASCRGFPTPLALAAEWSGLARRWPRRFGQYRLRDFDHRSFRAVDQPMASCLLLRRRALQRVGLFDPQFRIFFNDVDLCLRLRRDGWRIDYLPTAAILHYGGASTRQVRPAMVRESRDALLRYLAKHDAPRRGRLANALLAGLVRTTFGLRLQLDRWRQDG
ncbi:MAG: glycosyltransferase family 2 protein [Fimbriimonadaceae bacterium]|nr:glycosyltransferase family 2 protein [Fimbriimonadaceae bacterium]